MRTVLPSLLALISAFSPFPTYGQSTSPVQSDRLPTHPSLTATTRLPGHIPAWARAEADQGPIPDATPLRVTLVLARSPERQAAFTQFLEDQQNPASPNYHHWLTPQQVGDQYGPTQHDLDALSTWLTARGLTVTELAPSRVFVHASAPAATLARAFATTFHTFAVGDAALRAPLTDPVIPTAFAPLIQSIHGLADTPLEPQNQHHASPTPDTLHPEYTTSATTHFVTPGDFATIFDLKPTYSAGYNGAGQKIAIIGRSRVVTTDISEFETNTGLPANFPNVVIPPTGVDPGITGTGDQSEATLDVVRVFGTAPGVQADLVISGTAGGLNGIYVAAQYNVQTLLDPVMTISFGSCETYAGPSQVNLWDTLFAQAASEGISVFVSASDSGAATCDTQFAAVPSYQFRSINYICASSYATCVGGTEFADTASPSTYWSTTNTADRSSALSYIPEGAWNEPQNSSGAYVAASGGGGASLYIAKPTWQTGAGIPADGARDVPDISFPAAGHDGYYACYALGNGDCAANRFEYFSGTSAAAPGMAAVTAILNQKTGVSHGNLNPILYRTAANTPAAFHDATPASSGVASCSTAIASMCNNSLPSPTGLTGGLAGYALTAGYDQATGLGSLDITAFLNANSTPVATLASGKLILTESASTIANTQTDIFTATYTSATAGIPTGTVQFYANSTPIGQPVPLASGKAVTSALPFPAAGSYDVTAIYSGDATFAQTTAPGIALTVTGIFPVPKVTLSSSTIGVGSTINLTVTLPATGSIAPTGMVRFFASGPVSGYVATVPLASGTATAYEVTFASVGTYAITAYYLGDAAYSPTQSAPVTLTVQKVPSFLILSQNYAAAIGLQGSSQYTVQVANGGFLATPAATGTMQVFANGVSIGTFTAPNPGVAVQQFNIAGAYSITASYSGDANWQPSTATPVSLTVLSDPASYHISPPLQPVAIVTAGATFNNGGAVQLISMNGFQGTVAPVCTIAYNGTGSAIPPTCAFDSTVAITLSANPYANFRIASVASQAVKQTGTSASNSRFPGLVRRTSPIALVTALILCLPLRRRSWKISSSVFSLVLLLTSISGCGSSSSPAAYTPTPTPVPVQGTTKGSYTITITASTTVPNTPVPSPVTVPLTVN